MRPRAITRRLARSRSLRRAGIVCVGAGAIATALSQVTAGLPQSALAVLLVVLLWGEVAKKEEGPVWCAFGFICVGVAVRMIPIDPATKASDALIAEGVLFILVSLLVPLAARIRDGGMVLWVKMARTRAPYAEQRLVPQAERDASGSRDGPSASAAGVLQARARIDSRLIFVAASVLASLYALAHATPIGVGAGALIWSYHYFVSPLSGTLPALLDPLTRLSHVAVPDSLLLTLLKALHPGAVYGGLFNLIDVLGLSVFVVGAFMFVRLFVPQRAAAALAVALFLALPVGYPLRFAAPFDFGPVLLLAALTARSATFSVPLLIFALLVGTLNTANGFELLPLIAALRFMPGGFRVTRAKGLWYCASAAVGSVVAALILHPLALMMTLRQNWWLTDELARIASSEGIRLFTASVALTVVLCLTGLVLLYRRNSTAMPSLAAMLAISAALGLPVHFGGVPVLSPARLLQYLMPQGWPSARLAEVGVFSLLIPVAVVLDALLTKARSYTSRDPTWLGSVTAPAATVVAALAIVLGALRPAYDPQNDLLSALNRHARVIFFPQAEAGSRAGILYARDLLASGRTVLEPLVYATGTSILGLGNDPSAPRTLSELERLRVDYVVVRSDLYNDPRSRTEAPQLYDINASRQPVITGVPELALNEFAPNALIFRLIPDKISLRQ